MNTVETKRKIAQKVLEDYSILKDQRKELDKSGVYVIKADDKIIYVGESSCLLKRFLSHKYNTLYGLPEHKYEVFRNLIELGKNIKCEAIESFDVDDKENRLYRQAYWINQLNPILNVQIPWLDQPQRYSLNLRAKTITAQQIINEVIDGLDFSKN